MIVWVLAGLLGLATGLRIGWALVNKQSLILEIASSTTACTAAAMRDGGG